MDIFNLVTLICDEMSDCLNEDQLQRLEGTLFKQFRNLRVIDECRDLEVAPFDGDFSLMKLFIATKRLAGRAESTLEQYNLEAWTARAYIGKSFKEITTMDLKMYLAAMKAKGLSPSTLNNKRRYLSSFFRFLHEEGYITDNPITRIDTIKEPERTKPAYHVDDMETLRMSCDHPRDRAIIEFLLATGLRISELTALDVKDIDRDHRRFDVIGKGDKQRTAFYDEMAEFYLNRYFRWRLEHENITDEELKDRPLFAQTKAPYGRLENNGVRCMLKRVASKAGVENVHPHRFRRTFATNALHRHMPIDKVQGIMGHVKVETTLLYIDHQDDLEQSYRMYMA